MDTSQTHQSISTPQAAKPPIHSHANAIPEQRSKTRQEIGHRIHTKQEGSHHTQNQATKKLIQGVLTSGESINLASIGRQESSNHTESQQEAATNVPIVFYPTLVFTKIVDKWSEKNIIEKI